MRRERKEGNKEPSAIWGRIKRQIALRKKLIRSFTHIFAGNLAAQVLFFAFTIFLPPLYGPQKFGDFSLFLSGLNVLTLFAHLRYDQVVVTPAHPEENREIVRWGWMVGLVFIVVGLGISLGLIAFVSKGNFQWLPFAVFGAFLSGGIQLLQQWLVVKGNFTKLGWSRFVFAFSSVSLQAGLLWVDPSRGLILGYVGGLLISLVFLRNEFWETLPPFSLEKGWKNIGKPYWPVVRFSLWSGLLSVFIGNFQPFLVAGFFNIQQAGFYFLAYRILGLPFNLISSSIGPIFIRKMVGVLKKGSGEGFTMMLRMIWILLGTLSGLSILAIAVLPFFLRYLWGPSWDEVSRMALWMIPLSISNALVTSINNLAEILQRTKVDLIFGAMLALVSIVAILIGGHFQDFFLFLWIFSFGSALLKGGIVIYYLRVLKRGNL